MRQSRFGDAALVGWRRGRARELHRRLLPLIIRETFPFMRYILKRRGVFSSTIERAPAGVDELDADDKREISTLIEAIQADVLAIRLAQNRGSFSAFVECGVPSIKVFACAAGSKGGRSLPT